MPVLAGFLGSIFLSMAQFFAQYIGKRLAILAAVITAVVTLTTVFVAAINGLWAGLSAVAVPEPISIAASWFMPPNTDDCIAAWFAARLARWVYEWNIKIVQFKLF